MCAVCAVEEILKNFEKKKVQSSSAQCVGFAVILNVAGDQGGGMRRSRSSVRIRFERVSASGVLQEVRDSRIVYRNIVVTYAWPRGFFFFFQFFAYFTILV